MSASGAKVLMLRSVELARNHGVRIHARSTFSDEEGTWVQEGDPMEQPIVSAVTHSENDVVFTLSDIPDRPGVAALIFDVVAAAQVNVDTIIQNVVHGNAEMSFSVPAEDVPATQAALDGHAGRARRVHGRGEPRPRQGVADRRRHALAPRRRGEDVPHPRRQRGQPADDLDLADQDLLHDRPLGDPERGARAARRVRARERADRRSRRAAGRLCPLAAESRERWTSRARTPRRCVTAVDRHRRRSSRSGSCSSSSTTATSGACGSATRWPSPATGRRSTSPRRVTVCILVIVVAWSVLSLYDVTSQLAKALLASSAVLALFAGLAFSTPLSNLGSGLLVVVHAAAAPRRPDHGRRRDGLRRGHGADLHDARHRRRAPDLRPEHAADDEHDRQPHDQGPAPRDHGALPRLDRHADPGGARGAPRRDRRAAGHARRERARVTVGEISDRTVWLEAATYGPLDADVVSLSSELRERGLVALRERGSSRADTRVETAWVVSPIKATPGEATPERQRVLATRSRAEPGPRAGPRASSACCSRSGGSARA